ncbi:hypothetical protein BSAE_1764 [Bifidobacterium pullorum subsp. saeculare DSM 6531 = LMG 14934]|uniref:Uncharacterized protein n=1 Tax=Bifidobacterium pullorum subsp. saeculare DSM 6531 = LMG 14934 TaxID=1437611 RepID=A0A087CXX9_9BIFI|nr:hypothetical protein BSAE_1764 [Bifidobacterium pullorum subsp. saeculare DSM 6531 = LMG 14934]
MSRRKPLDGIGIFSLNSKPALRPKSNLWHGETPALLSMGTTNDTYAKMIERAWPMIGLWISTRLMPKARRFLVVPSR